MSNGTDPESRTADTPPCLPGPARPSSTGVSPRTSGATVSASTPPITSTERLNCSHPLPSQAQQNRPPLQSQEDSLCELVGHMIVTKPRLGYF